MSIDLVKTTQAVRVDYNGSNSYVLPSGTRIEMKIKEPQSGWVNVLETTVPEGKQWNFIVSITAHESDE